MRVLKQNDLHFQGPVPKFDPAFMLQSLQGYTPHKAATGQNMTKWDHKVRLWMENVMATAYGVAPALAMELPDVPVPQEFLMRRNSKGKLVQRLDDKGMPIANPDYEEEVADLGRAMAPIYEDLCNRQAFARRAAHGFNITFEMLRYARNLNFANEVNISQLCPTKLPKRGGGVSVVQDIYSYFSWLFTVP
jgi:hypothetical protein